MSDWDVEVRVGLAGNPSLPALMLRELSTDNRAEVRDVADVAAKRRAADPAPSPMPVEPDVPALHRTQDGTMEGGLWEQLPRPT